jgi:hypothetical protein
MADPRPKHFTYPTTLLNQPHEFAGAANAMYKYGPRGPTRNHNRPLSGGPPASIEESISQAVGRVAGLSSKQRNAVLAEMVRLSRDLHYIRQVMEEAKAKGPWSEAAATGMDEGRPL